MPPRLESPTNPRVAAAVRAIARGERMALESPRMLAEALDAGLAIEEVFHDASVDGPLLARAAAAGASLTAVSSRVLGKLTDLPSPRGLFALARRPVRALDDLRPGAGIGVLLDGVQDPANVGAILRSAEAFGASFVLLSTGSASPFAARALRASSGSALRVPVASGFGSAEVVAFARRQKMVLAGTLAAGGEDPTVCRVSGPILLAIGSEGHGLSPEIEEALEIRLTIPMAGRVESLNAAVAASILLYAFSRKTSAAKR